MAAMRPIALFAASALLASLAACGGESEPTKATPTAKATKAKPKPTPEPTLAAGTPAPEALSKFQCAENKGKWKASGYLSNKGKSAATFQVTVYIGPPDGERHAARTKRVASVAPGGSTSFEITKVPTEGDGPCNVQVLRLD